VSEQEPDPQAPPTATPLPPAGIPAGRIFGVPLVVSPFFLVIIVFAVISLPTALRARVHGLGSTQSTFAAVGLVALVYGAVLLHEASHVIVARALGLRVGRIVLQFLGAQSEILDEPPTAAASYLVAAVGPMTSVLLAGIGAAVGRQFPVDSLGWVMGTSFAWVNAILAVFNLLPGLPLDGGQMLRSGIWQVTHDKMRSLLIAGWVGRVVAGLAIVAAMFAFPASKSNDWAANRVFAVLYVVLISLFIYANATMAINRAKLGTVVPRLEMASLLRPVLTVEAQLPLAEAVRRARAIGARALVVVDARDRWSGIVSESAVQGTPLDRQPWMSVSDLARPVEDGLVLSPTLSGEALMAAMQKTPASEYLVADSDGLRGVLASADLVAALHAAGVH
jgi:Zn-dependent protease